MDNETQKIIDRNRLATASLTFGIVGIVGMFVNISVGSTSFHLISSLGIISIPFLIIGLVLGILGIKSSKKTFALAGIILCSIGLIIVFLVSTMRVSGPTIIETTTANTQL